MKDANGRIIVLGDDIIALRYDTSDLGRLPRIIKDATLGKVIEITEDSEGAFVSLGDGITYGTDKIVTFGGLEFVDCAECGKWWVFDVRMNEEEECPFCEAPHTVHGWTWICQWCEVRYSNVRIFCGCRPPEEAA